MANILDIKRRIRSVINTRQITKAMKMVSAAKLRRAQDRALAARPYAQMLTNVLEVAGVAGGDLRSRDRGAEASAAGAAAGKEFLLIVVTGDKGLAGAFNTNILKAAMQFIGREVGQEHRNRNHRPQRTRFPAPPVFDGRARERAESAEASRAPRYWRADRRAEQGGSCSGDQVGGARD